MKAKFQKVNKEKSIFGLIFVDLLKRNQRSSLVRQDTFGIVFYFFYFSRLDKVLRLAHENIEF